MRAANLSIQERIENLKDELNKFIERKYIRDDYWKKIFEKDMHTVLGSLSNFAKAQPPPLEIQLNPPVDLKHAANHLLSCISTFLNIYKKNQPNGERSGYIIEYWIKQPTPPYPLNKDEWSKLRKIYGAINSSGTNKKKSQTKNEILMEYLEKMAKILEKIVKLSSDNGG